MTTLTLTYTSTGSEPPDTWVAASPLPAFTGAYTVTWACSAPNPGFVWMGVEFIKYIGGTPTACWQDTVVFSGSDVIKSNGYNTSFIIGGGGCMDWTNIVFYTSGPGGPPGAGVVWTFTIDGPFAAPALPCAYGTRQKAGSGGVLDAAGAAVTFFIANPLARWLAGLVGVTIARPLVLSSLCSGLPPADETIFIPDFLPVPSRPWMTEAQRKAGVKLYRWMWDQYCECVPESGVDPPPVGPGVTIYDQPTYYITNNNNTISNTDIANTLNLFLTLKGGDSYIAQNTLAESSLPSRCAPAAYEEGTVHEGLIGEGRFDYSGVVGFKVEVVDFPSGGLMLEGQPMYLWNMGWISALAGELLLEEKRVTRSGYLWFPCSIHLGDEFTYTLKPDVELKVTELVKPTAIVLMS